MNPYLVLNVPTDADDRRIREAYLEAVKRATPDSDPAGFQAISEAYNRIKDELSRSRYFLFDKTSPGDSPAAVFFDHFRLQRGLKPPPFEAMKEFLRACMKN